MNFTNTEIPNPSNGYDIDPRVEIIGCAKIFPIPVSLDCGSLFHMVMRMKLEASGLSAGNWMGISRPRYFMWGCGVFDRNKGLSAMREALADKGMIPGFPQIAYWDKSELCWRNVLGDAQPFDRFFSEDEILAAKLDIQHRTALWMSAIERNGTGGSA